MEEEFTDIQIYEIELGKERELYLKNNLAIYKKMRFI